jgi:hypothetical protein
MKYFIKRWKKGYGIWHGWRWFNWRVPNVGPFGSDSPWLSRNLAELKIQCLMNPLKDFF